MAEHRRKLGISNRESGDEEARERARHPALAPDSPPQNAPGEGEETPADEENRQTSHKAGSRSTAQKAARSKYTDRAMPASRKVAGAFGEESDGDEKGSKGG